tara:strand:- start:1799 stop:2059 length:261 start_codon:yes stop_codon:yes gene_type:complete
MAVKQAQKFTEEELTSLKELQNQSQGLTYKAGQVYLQKMVIEEQESNLKNNLDKLKESESTMAQQLTEKYGKGTIDIESGEFVPAE